MGNAIVNSHSGSLKTRLDGFYGSVEQLELPIVYTAIETIVGENTLTTSDNGNTLTWTKPTLLGNGGAIPASTITGYKVYRAGSSGSYDYTVAATYSGGQTVLSNHVEENYWFDNLPAQTAGNTFDNTDSQATIQAYVDTLVSTGGTIYLDGTAGSFSWTTTGFEETGAFISITRAQTSGNTSDNYINIIGINGAVIEGVGSDSTPSGNQSLIDIGGQYIRISDIEVKDSGKYGMNLHGNNILVRECNANNNWLHGFCVGDENDDDEDCANITIEYCIAHNNRIGSGFAIIVEDNTNYNVDDITFKRCISFRNGWARDNTLYEFMGGNSDGFVCDKKLHTNYMPGDNLDPAVTGRSNRARNIVFGECVSYRNADDGADLNTGNGSVFNGFIMLDNGPSGRKALKVFNSIYEEVTIGNFLAIGLDVSAYPDTVIYTDNQIAGRNFVIGNTVRGRSADDASIGASGTVVSFTQGTNVTDQGILVLSGVTGTWRSEDILEDFTAGQDICGISVAKPGVLGLGTTQGIDGRVNDSEPTRDYGTINLVGVTTINHDLPGAIACRGIGGGSYHPSTSPETYNLISYYNKSNDSMAGRTETTSLLNNGGVAPDLENTGASYIFNEVLTGSTNQEKWRDLYWKLTAEYMPTSGGNCQDAGTGGALLGPRYHATAGDDTTNPADPEDFTLLKWTGSSPDIGAVPYEYMRPPVLSIS